MGRYRLGRYRMGRYRMGGSCSGPGRRGHGRQGRWRCHPAIRCSQGIAAPGACRHVVESSLIGTGPRPGRPAPRPRIARRNDSRDENHRARPAEFRDTPFHDRLPFHLGLNRNDWRSINLNRTISLWLHRNTYGSLATAQACPPFRSCRRGHPVIHCASTFMGMLRRRIHRQFGPMCLVLERFSRCPTRLRRVCWTQVYRIWIWNGDGHETCPWSG